MSNLSMAQGDTLVEQVTFTDQLGALINDPTASYELTAKYQYSDLDADAIFSVSSVQTTPGVAYLTVTPASTAACVPPAVLLYDIRVKETSGRVTTLATGTFTVTPAVLVAL